MSTTPAGWYDDGSGRQRWWDGQQWTEHFAPEAGTAAAEAETAVIPPSVDDTVIRPSDTAATTPLGSGFDTYAPPAASTGYPGAAASYPDSSANLAAGYPATAAYGQPAPDAPRKVSVLGLVGLGLAAVGTILVFFPVVGFIGFFLLAAGFIVALISLFLKGKKWPGITGLILAVVGTIIGVVMSFIYVFAFAQGVSEELDRLPSSAPSIESTAPGDDTSTDDGATASGRPTVQELESGIGAIIESSGAEGYTPEQITCFATEFEASDLDDETLRIIASGDSATFSDADAALAFTEKFADALPVCLLP